MVSKNDANTQWHITLYFFKSLPWLTFEKRIAMRKIHVANTSLFTCVRFRTQIWNGFLCTTMYTAMRQCVKAERSKLEKVFHLVAADRTRSFLSTFERRVLNRFHDSA
jgi:hypothetical protein